MPFDQNITYRVNVDDSNFQAKLTQMRASMDSVVGGMGGMGAGMGGFGVNMAYGMMGAMSGVQSSFGSMNMGGGLADFGSQIRPVTYTPPAIAMQPHFGMIQVQQTLGQAGLGTMGPIGAAISGAMTNYRTGGFSNMLFGPDAIPPQISVAEYTALSARGFGGRLGDSVATGALTGAGTLGSIAAGGVGTSIGQSLFASGVGRFLGGAVGGMVGGMIVSDYVNQVTDMMANNRSIQSALEAGSFRFMTGGPGTDRLTGRGFDRRSRAGIASSIQDMELNDVRFGRGEYGQILEAGMQMDMFSGTRDVDDFKSRFKGLVENIKTVSATLHTSLKEGMEVIRGLRDMGVTDPSMVNQITMRSEMLGRASGRTGMEMMAIGQAGAEIFRGTGVSMQRGFELNQQNAAGIRNMLNQGTISRETVAQAGGENSLAQMMTSNALAGFQTTLGRGAMMANFDPATGGMRADFLTRMAGQGSMSMVAGAARLTPAQIMQFQAHQEEIISEMSPMQMQMFGIATRMGTARDMQRAFGGTLEDNFVAYSKMQGVSKEIINTELAMLRQNPEQMRQSQATALNAIRQQAGMEDLRNRFGLKAISNWWQRGMVKPVSDAFMSMSTDIGEAVDDFALGITGAAAVDSTTASSQFLLDMGKRVQQRNEQTNSMANARVTDATGNFFARRFGQSSKELFESFNKFGKVEGDSVTFNGASAKLFDSMDEVQAYSRVVGGNVTVLGEKDGKVMVLSDEQMKRGSDRARGLQSTEAERAKIEKMGLNDETRANLQFISQTNASLGRKTDLAKVARTVLGSDFDYKAWASGDGEFSYKGLSRGEVSAMLQGYLEKDGDMLKDAASEYDAVTGQRGFSNLASRSRKEILDGVEDKKEQLTNILYKNMGIGAFSWGDSRKLRNASAEQIVKISQAVASGKSADMVRARDTLKELGFADADTYLANLKGLSEEQRKALSSGADDIAMGVAAARKVEDSATGGQAGGGAIVGEISKDTMLNIEKMSNQLLQNYEQLIAMQKQLNELQRNGKH